MLLSCECVMGEKKGEMEDEESVRMDREGESVGKALVQRDA